MDPIRFDISGYCITLWCTAGFVSSVQKNVVYLPVVEGDGRDVWSSCENLAATDFALVCITGMDWNNDLSPWESEGVFSADAPFGGNASATLQLITGLIAPVVERTLAVQNPIRTIAVLAWWVVRSLVPIQLLFVPECGKRIGIALVSGYQFLFSREIFS